MRLPKNISQSQYSQQKAISANPTKEQGKKKEYIIMTKPFPEETVQPPDSTENINIYEFPHYHGSKTNNIFLKLYNAGGKICSD